MLEGLGLDGESEAVYVSLLDVGKANARELAKAARVGLAACRRALTELEDLGLVSATADSPHSYQPAQPDIALEAAIGKQQYQLERLRLVGRDLMPRYLRGKQETPAGNPVEIVTGDEAVRQRTVQLQASAKTQVRMFDLPPYVVPGQINQTELEALARGVSFRVVYDTESLESAEKREWVRQSVESGEQARVTTGLPCKLNIADDTLAMTFSVAGGALAWGIVIHPSPLLEALCSLFELTWSRAGLLTPGQSELTGLLGPKGGDVVQLLAAGMKDESISRQLGINVRTVRRHVGVLSDFLGVTSRTQLGVELARREWV
jgi:sugar-specific transcriptional regulator TrmB/DNA-binding CsgD family transcriptional regulator